MFKWMPIWMRILVVLMVVSVAVSTALLSAVELGFTAIVIASAVMVMLLGLTSLAAFWLAMWVNSPEFKNKELMRAQRELLRQNEQLKRAVFEREQHIANLEAQMNKFIQEEVIRRTLPPHPISQPPAYREGRPDIRQTGAQPVVDRTGEYQSPVTAPSYNGHTGADDAHRSREQIDQRTTPSRPVSLPDERGVYSTVPHHVATGEFLRTNRHEVARNGNGRR